MQSYVFDINESDFEVKVLKASFKKPILVDFWAPWCGPCKSLSPILEKIVNEYSGEVLLAKINTDNNPQLAQIFGIQGIPAVKLIKDGDILDEFTGALPEQQIRKFLSQHILSQEKKELIEIQELIEKKKSSKAQPRLRSFLEQYPQNNQAKIMLSELLLSERTDKTRLQATELLSSIEMGQAEYDKAQSLIKKAKAAEKIQDGSSIKKIRKSLSDDDKNWQLHFELGEALIGDEQLIESLEHLMLVLENTSDELKSKAHQSILTVFELLGQGHPEVMKYRRRLAGAIF